MLLFKHCVNRTTCLVLSGAVNQSIQLENSAISVKTLLLRTGFVFFWLPNINCHLMMFLIITSA